MSDHDNEAENTDEDAGDQSEEPPGPLRLSRGCTIALVAGFSLAFLATSLVLLILFLIG